LLVSIPFNISSICRLKPYAIPLNKSKCAHVRLIFMHEAVTVVAKYGILIPIASYLVLVYCQKRNIKDLLLLTILSGILAIIFVKIATILHNDPRPFIRDGVKPYFNSATDNGFPSDHTVLSAFIAFIVMKYYKWAGLLLFAVAVLIGAARVIGGVHHGQDVIASIIIAALSVYIGTLAISTYNNYETKDQTNKS
jgi:membrane-associated phospholipid phosphatase